MMPSMQATSNLRLWGPWMVGLGAALWGTESVWRDQLNKLHIAPDVIAFYKHPLAPDVIVFYEHALAMVVILPILLGYLVWYLARKPAQLRNIPASAFGYLIISGVAGSAVGTIFFTAALKHWNNSQANVLLCVQPLISTSLAVVLFKEKLAPQFKWIAGVTVIAGIAIAIDTPSNLLAPSKEGVLSLGFLFTMACAVCWGIATVAGRGVMMHMPVPLAVSLRYVVGLICTLLIVLARGKFNSEGLQPGTMFDWQALRWMLGLLAVSALTPSFFYFWGLRHSKAAIAGFFEMLQTLAALLVTWGIPAWIPALGLTAFPLRPHQIIAGVALLGCMLALDVIQQRYNIKEKGSSR